MDIIFSFRSPVLLAILRAICLSNIEHSLRTLSETENNIGVKASCYIFITQLLYWRFFSFSCLFRILIGERWFWEFALVFVTRISRKILALIPCLAALSIKPLMFSPFFDLRWDSISTALFTCFIRFATKSLMLQCLIMINHSRLQLSAWSALYHWPQGHWEGNPRSSLAYRILRASLNSPLFRSKLNYPSAATESQLNVPFSLASAIALLVCSGNFSSIF